MSYQIESEIREKIEQSPKYAEFYDPKHISYIKKSKWLSLFDRVLRLPIWFAILTFFIANEMFIINYVPLYGKFQYFLTEYIGIGYTFAFYIGFIVFAVPIFMIVEVVLRTIYSIFGIDDCIQFNEKYLIDKKVDKKSKDMLVLKSRS